MAGGMGESAPFAKWGWRRGRERAMMGAAGRFLEATWEMMGMKVRMELARILICDLRDLQVIELQEVGGERRFPILIGLGEAEAIRRRLQGEKLKRPLTHELLASVIDSFGGALESVTIHDLSDHTFYAKLTIRRPDGEVMDVDSRPSDAIALGAATNVPIYVEEPVLMAAQTES
jgi:bifunctional DNase/RNase